MAKIGNLGLVALGAWAFTACTVTFPPSGTSLKAERTPNGGVEISTKMNPEKKTDLELQSICDVSRSRAREQLLKRMNIEEFRAVALKISQAVTSDELADLVRLHQARNPGGNASHEEARGRSDLITEIYTSAILKAGYKPGAIESISGTDLAYSTGTAFVGAGDDSYTTIVMGRLVKGTPPEGELCQVSLSANPDQSRYYIELSQVSRYETQADGTTVPIYTTSNLFDFVDAMLPHYCGRVESALNLRDFNTIEGFKGDHTITQPAAPAPAPASAPTAASPTATGPTPATLPATTTGAAPAPAAASVPVPATATASGPVPAPASVPGSVTAPFPAAASAPATSPSA